MDIEWVSEVASKVGTLLPLVWLVFVMTEWIALKRFYSDWGMKHCPVPSGKIAFNPNYFISLFFSSINFGIMMTLLHFYSLCGMRYYIVVTTSVIIFYVLWICKCIHKRDSKVNLLRTIENQKEKTISLNGAQKPLEQYYDEINHQFKDEDLSCRILRLLGLLFVLYSLVVMDFPEGDLPSSVLELKSVLHANMPKSMSLRDIAYMLAFLITCGFVHSLFNDYRESKQKRYEQFEQLRIFERDGKEYAILVPPTQSANGTYVAVRIVVCKKENTLRYGFLIPEDVIIQKEQFEGELKMISFSILVLPVDDDKPVIANDDKALQDWFIEHGMAEFQYNHQWKPIRYFQLKNKEGMLKN